MHTIVHHLKMQVEACAVAGIAYITYNLPCRYRFPCGNGSLRHVGVPRGQARAVSRVRCWRFSGPGGARGWHTPALFRQNPNLKGVKDYAKER